MIARQFLHPPRTGGSSLHVAWGLRRPEYNGHAAPVPALFSYGFARNPWDRAVSLFLLGERVRAAGNEYPGGFGQWVRDDMPHPDEGFTVPVDFNLPCSFWLANADWVGRFETRAADLATLRGILSGQSVPRRAAPEHIERSVGRNADYTTYYDRTTQGLIATKYADDITAYGYRF